MAALVDYAANSDSDEEKVTQNEDEDAKLHLRESKRSIDDMKSNMKLNIRPEISSTVRVPTSVLWHNPVLSDPWLNLVFRYLMEDVQHM